MRKQLGFTAFELLIAVLVMLGVGGWVANVIKLVGMLGGDVSAMFIARIAGVFLAPFGSILGFL